MCPCLIGSVYFPLASILTQHLCNRYFFHVYPRAIQFWNHMGSILGLLYKTAQTCWYEWDCSKLCFSRSFPLKHGVEEILPLFCAQTGPPPPVSMQHTPQAYPCLCSDSEAQLKSHYKNATVSRKSLTFHSVSKGWVRENLFSCPYFSFLLYPVKATVWAIYQDDFLWLKNKENAHMRCRKISQINRWEDFT